MKQAKVIIGETYWARISGRLRQVIVVGVKEPSFSCTRRSFVLKDAKTGKVLPKSRTAAALTPIGYAHTNQRKN